MGGGAETKIVMGIRSLNLLNLIVSTTAKWCQQPSQVSCNSFSNSFNTQIYFSRSAKYFYGTTLLYFPRADAEGKNPY